MAYALARTPVELATDILGDAWSILVLRESLLLGSRRFVDLRESLGVNRATLVDRLDALVEEGLLNRASLSAESDRAAYVPTPRAEQYLPVLLSMFEWGRRWQVRPDEGPLLRVVHEPCGAMLATSLTCGACGGPVAARSVDAERPAEGARRSPPPSGVRMPQLDQLEREHRCPIARCLSSIGDRWSMLIIQEAFFGLRHFDAFARRLGIASNTLANRLSRLCKHGILERRADGSRPVYRLTEKGLDLYRVPATVRQWAIDVLGAEDPLRLTHRWCGKRLTVVVRCTHCGGEVRPGQVRAEWIDSGRHTRTASLASRTRRMRLRILHDSGPG